ncbi:MAG TPA: acyltransferase family protein, partial [Vicinamibacteria bacterium]|nr:acyltransferase family protein [Vicinamibacteria bacterium]
ARLAFGRERPARAFLVAMALAVATYVPLALAVNPLAWWNAGPFFVQTSRIGLYLAWFALGTALGAAGPGQGILAREGRLARTPGRWIAASALAFVGFVAALLFALAAYGRGTPSVALDALASTGYAISCAVTSFAALASALRWLRAPGALGLALSRDAFGIYLLHYPAVSWLQRMLLPVALPGVAKAGIVLAGAVGLSWAASAAFRAVVQGLRASWAGPSITSAHSRPRA